MSFPEVSRRYHKRDESGHGERFAQATHYGGQDSRSKADIRAEINQRNAEQDANEAGNDRLHSSGLIGIFSRYTLALLGAVTIHQGSECSWKELFAPQLRLKAPKSLDRVPRVAISTGRIRRPFCASYESRQVATVRHSQHELPTTTE